MNTTKEVEDYLDWCKEGGACPRLIGYFPFEVLFRSGRLAPHYSTIRVMYTGPIDTCYYINEAGMLEQIGVENPVALNPREVLSVVKHPEGWEPEGLRPKNL